MHQRTHVEEATGADTVRRRRSSIVKAAGGMLAAVGLACSIGGTANANLLTNGGFETGDLTGWTETGDTVFNSVECPGPSNVFAGFCDYAAGPPLTFSTLSQTFNSVIGGNYVVTFAVDPDNNFPNTFAATLNGASLFSTANTDLPYALHRVLATATSTTSTIAFRVTNPGGFTRLDAVSVDVPEPAPFALIGLGLSALWLGKRRKV